MAENDEKRETVEAEVVEDKKEVLKQYNKTYKTI